MNRIWKLAVTACCFLFLCGCSDVTGHMDLDAISQQVETIAGQIDMEAMLDEVISRINREDLKAYAQQGYDALTEKYPALRKDNITSFLKNNGLELMNRYLESSDADMQENARKLGEILKILNPELSDEVDAVIAK